MRYALVLNTKENKNWKDDQFFPGHFELLVSPLNDKFKPVVAHYQSAKAWVHENIEYVQHINQRLHNGKGRIIPTEFSDERITKRFKIINPHWR